MEGTSTTSASKFDKVKHTVAEKLHDAADSIRRKTEAPDKHSGMDEYGRRASSLLDQSADYIRDFDIKRADADLQKQIRNYPGRSLLIALGAGLLIGMMVRRR
jgi:hypothetical protein